MALPELLRVFEREAADEVVAILAAGEADARAIDAEAARVRREKITGAAAATALEHRRLAEGAVAQALHRSRAVVLTARAAMLGRLREATETELARRIGGDPRLADTLVAAAIACAGDEAGTLRCTPELEKAARAAAPPGLRVEPDPAVTTGVVVELATGTIIDASLLVLLDREWARLATEAVR
jgi:vacuolar-type H+-ATPase subunit E/Vma4